MDGWWNGFLNQEYEDDVEVSVYPQWSTATGEEDYREYEDDVEVSVYPQWSTATGEEDYREYEDDVEVSVYPQWSTATGEEDYREYEDDVEVSVYPQWSTATGEEDYREYEDDVEVSVYPQWSTATGEEDYREYENDVEMSVYPQWSTATGEEDYREYEDDVEVSVYPQWSTATGEEDYRGDATTTICHRYTPPEQLEVFTKTADIISVAVGIPKLIRAHMITEGAAIIDLGINRVKDEDTGKIKVVGDVDVEGDATTTICHRYNPPEQLEVFTNTADIIAVAMGIPKLIRAHMIKEGAAIIDVGINRVKDEETGKMKLVGDVDFEGDATTTICHRYTPPEQLEVFTKTADIIVVAVGIRKLIRAHMITEGAAIIDVGINRVKDEETGKMKLVGDVDFEGDATTTICHRYTPPEQLEVFTKTADIIVVAVGIRKLIRAHMITEGAAIIDVGINRVKDEETGKMKLVGDVDFEGDATTTICHRYTPPEQLEVFTKTADIIVVAVGIRKLIRAHMITEGAAIIDVGINRVKDEETGKMKLVGDVDFEGDATTTICHRYTPPEQLEVFTNTADIIAVAVGIPKLIRAHMIKEGAAIIDVGINRVKDEETGKMKLVGDVDFEGDATTTICHRYTPPEQLEVFTKTADIIVVAVGIRKLIRAHMITEGAAIIDVGINRVKDEETGKMKLVGDVDFEGDATTTICHRYTPPEQLEVFTNTADIIAVAVGIPKLIRAHMIKEGAAIIDVGINRVKDEETGKMKLVGDVDFEGDATTTICHRYTPPEQLEVFTNTADIIAVAVGIPKLIRAHMITEGAAIIDVGINRVKDEDTGKMKLVGDVDFEDVTYERPPEKEMPPSGKRRSAWSRVVKSFKNMFGCCIRDENKAKKGEKSACRYRRH